MAAKDFKSGIKAGSLTGRNFSKEGIAIPFTQSNQLQEELVRQTQELVVQDIPINQLRDNPFQYLARQELDGQALEELASSIEQNGFFGSLLARPKPGATEQEYELAFGHRRREAAKLVGLRSLPVKVVDLTDDQMAQIMASENFSRQDLTPLNEAKVVGLLIERLNLSVAQIARVVGQGEGWVKLRRTLYEAPVDIQLMVERKPDSLSYVRLLLLTDGPKRAELIRAVLEEGLNREGLEARLGKMKPLKTKTPSTPAVENVVNAIPQNDFAAVAVNRVEELPDFSSNLIVNSVTQLLQYPNGDISHNVQGQISTSIPQVFRNGVQVADVQETSQEEPEQLLPSAAPTLTGSSIKEWEIAANQLTQAVEKLEVIASTNRNPTGLTASHYVRSSIKGLNERLTLLLKTLEEEENAVDA